jgi:hypothetical protein
MTLTTYCKPLRSKPVGLSGMALEMALRRMKVDVTVHDFRSAFRDWAGKRTTFPRVAEAALAHLVGDAGGRSVVDIGEVLCIPFGSKAGP